MTTRLVWNTNMAAVLLFWNTNMAAVTSCENALFEYKVNGAFSLDLTAAMLVSQTSALGVELFSCNRFLLSHRCGSRECKRSINFIWDQFGKTFTSKIYKCS